ncbi:ribosomal protein S18 acetylase RimI-like enzyme [Pedobacter sp. AK017]|uniref:GNAT family N-acetyltransferase n=1 Tax=Pedobacter sp. AK017 TaxID=2723073 RepID=UPI001611EA02|nr:N-acetyltransferase [Pedobacter sp. AK017]MBB5437513.1 ribosomal protein S18 acetylase RimI-like enzyme [Pedobacter sp. AK017]
MIRQAKPDDAAAIASLIILAMDSLAAKFVAGKDPEEAVLLFERFAALPANQYSYENTLVYEDGAGVSGMISAYDGADLELLRAPFLAYISHKYGFPEHIEHETQAGEYYIDCVSVAPGKQGKGIGKELIRALIAHALSINKPLVGLLVSKENPKAEKLYASLGFQTVNEKEFMGGNYLHMQYKTLV